MRHITRWIALTVASMILLAGLPFTSTYASGSSQDLTDKISVLPTYFLPQGSGWVDSGHSDPAKLPWGSDVTIQKVAVCWTLKDTSTQTASTGDYFTFTLPLDFVADATSSVYSVSGTYIGLATFTKDGFIRVEINTSWLSPAEPSPRSGYIPFLMLRPTVAGGSGTGASSSGGTNTDGSSAGGNSSSSSHTSSQSDSSGGSGTGSSLQSADTVQSVQTTETSTVASVEPTTPPSVTNEDTVTVIARPTSSEEEGPLFTVVKDGLGTLALALMSAGILFLALLIFLKRRRSRS